MAKISKINVAITGDATGLVAATDKATTNLRKFRAEQERSQKRLSGMQGTVNKTAESLGKLGMQSRGLGALSGGLGLMQAGPAGLALAGVGAMASVVSSINSAIEGMGDQRKQAAEAAKIIAREPWRRAEEFGFTQKALENLANPANASAMSGSALEGRGFMGGIQLGLAETENARRVEENWQMANPLSSSNLGLFGATVGGMMGGEGFLDALDRATTTSGQAATINMNEEAETIRGYTQQDNLWGWFMTKTVDLLAS